MDLLGQRLGDYRLLRRLGRGAMATVYLAEQESLARRVAVKVLNAELCRDQEYVERFGHEARAAASLVHPGIVQVYEVGAAEVGGVLRSYLAMEYAAGGSLGRLVQQEGALSPGRVLDVLWQVAASLTAAADRGLVHRDIKPDNLMVDRSGAIKVADFGLARLVESQAPRMTQVGVAMGTPLYMSPEQIEGREVDARSDLYSLGVTAYQLLTGSPPFTGDTPLSVAVQHLNNAPKPLAEVAPEAPAGLAGVIDRLLAKSPDDRFTSPAELLDRLSPLMREADAAGWASGALPSIAATSASGKWAPRSADEASAVERLSASMRGAPKPSRRRFTSGVLTLVVIGLVVGWVAGVVFAPRGVLLPRSPGVERFDDVRRQLFHAKLVDTPAAWRAVWENHPEADSFFHDLALRGGAVALLREGASGPALRLLERLPEGTNDPVILAARAAAYSRVGRDREAQTAAADLAAMSEQQRELLDRNLPDLAVEASEALRSDR